VTGPWTSEEDAVLRERFAANTHEELAVMLGRTRNAVRHRCWLLKLRRKAAPWTDREVDSLKIAYLSPHPNMAELERRFGRLRSNICRKARELGLTNQKRPKDEKTKAAMSARSKRWHATHEHPRGMLGKPQSEYARRRTSETARAMWADPNSKWNSPEAAQRRSDAAVARAVAGVGAPSRYSRCRQGIRPDLGIYLRSSWEANYARYLKMQVETGVIRGWRYEVKTFVFEKIKRGTRTYTPDFRVEHMDGRIEWHEVKGWMDDKSRVRLARMARYYPEETLVLIDKGWFRAANKSGLPSLIPHWEHGKTMRARAPKKARAA
jgi:hypothetical protein